MPPNLLVCEELVSASSYAEVTVGVLVFVPGLHVLTHWVLIAPRIATFPANLKMALHAARYLRIPPVLLWLRLPPRSTLIN